MKFNYKDIDNFIRVNTLASLLRFNVRKYPDNNFIFERRGLFGFLDAAFTYCNVLMQLKTYNMPYQEIVEIQKCLNDLYKTEFKVIQCYYNDIY